MPRFRLLIFCVALLCCINYHREAFVKGTLLEFISNTQAEPSLLNIENDETFSKDNLPSSSVVRTTVSSSRLRYDDKSVKLRRNSLSSIIFHRKQLLDSRNNDILVNAIEGSHVQADDNSNFRLEDPKVVPKNLEKSEIIGRKRSALEVNPTRSPPSKNPETNVPLQESNLGLNDKTSIISYAAVTNTSTNANDLSSTGRCASEIQHYCSPLKAGQLAVDCLADQVVLASHLPEMDPNAPHIGRSCQQEILRFRASHSASPINPRLVSLCHRDIVLYCTGGDLMTAPYPNDTMTLSDIRQQLLRKDHGPMASTSASAVATPTTTATTTTQSKSTPTSPMPMYDLQYLLNLPPHVGTGAPSTWTHVYDEIRMLACLDEADRQGDLTMAVGMAKAKLNFERDRGVRNAIISNYTNSNTTTIIMKIMPLGRNCRLETQRTKQQLAAAMAADPKLARVCGADALRLCPGVGDRDGQIQDCLRSNAQDLSVPCEAALVRRDAYASTESKGSALLYAKCLSDKRRFCPDIFPFVSIEAADSLDDLDLEDLDPNVKVGDFESKEEDLKESPFTNPKKAKRYHPKSTFVFSSARIAPLTECLESHLDDLDMSDDTAALEDLEERGGVSGAGGRGGGRDAEGVWGNGGDGGRLPPAVVSSSSTSSIYALRSLRRSCQGEVSMMVARRAADFRINDALVDSCRVDILHFGCLIGGGGRNGGGGGGVTINGTDNIVDWSALVTPSSSTHVRAIGAQVIRCLQNFHSELTNQDCRRRVWKAMGLASSDELLNAPLAEACALDHQRLCASIPLGGFGVTRCLEGHKTQLSTKCHKELFEEEREFSENIEFQIPLKRACGSEIQNFCQGIRPGGARVIRCLQDAARLATAPGSGFSRTCRTEVRSYEHRTAHDFRLNFRLHTACQEDSVRVCSQVCPGSIVLNASMAGGGPRNGGLSSSSSSSSSPSSSSSSYTPTPTTHVTLPSTHDVREKLAEVFAAETAREQEQEKQTKNMDSNTASFAERECGGKMLRCLTKHVTSLRNSECKAEVKYFSTMAAGDVEDDVILADACRTDVQHLCPRFLSHSSSFGQTTPFGTPSNGNDNGNGLSHPRSRPPPPSASSPANATSSDNNTPLSKTTSRAPKDYDVHSCLRRQRDRLTRACRREQLLLEERESNDLDGSSEESAPLVLLSKVCAKEKKLFCSGIRAGESRVFHCLVDSLPDPDFGETCRAVVVDRLRRRQANWRLDPMLFAACRDDVNRLACEGGGRGGGAKNGFKSNDNDSNNSGGSKSNANYANNEEDKEDYSSDDAVSEDGRVYRCLANNYSTLSSSCSLSLSRSLGVAFHLYLPSAPVTGVCDADVVNTCLKDRPNMAKKPGAVRQCLAAAVNQESGAKAAKEEGGGGRKRRRMLGSDHDDWAFAVAKSPSTTSSSSSPSTTTTTTTTTTPTTTTTTSARTRNDPSSTSPEGHQAEAQPSEGHWGLGEDASATTEDGSPWSAEDAKKKEKEMKKKKKGKKEKKEKKKGKGADKKSEKGEEVKEKKGEVVANGNASLDKGTSSGSLGNDSNNISNENGGKDNTNKISAITGTSGDVKVDTTATDAEEETGVTAGGVSPPLTKSKPKTKPKPTKTATTSPGGKAKYGKNAPPPPPPPKNAAEEEEDEEEATANQIWGGKVEGLWKVDKEGGEKREGAKEEGAEREGSKQTKVSEKPNHPNQTKNDLGEKGPAAAAAATSDLSSSASSSSDSSHTASASADSASPTTSILTTLDRSSFLKGMDSASGEEDEDEGEDNGEEDNDNDNDNYGPKPFTFDFTTDNQDDFSTPRKRPESSAVTLDDSCALLVILAAPLGNKGMLSSYVSSYQGLQTPNPEQGGDGQDRGTGGKGYGGEEGRNKGFKENKYSGKMDSDSEEASEFESSVSAASVADRLQAFEEFRRHRKSYNDNNKNSNSNNNNVKGNAEGRGSEGNGHVITKPFWTLVELVKTVESLKLTVKDARGKAVGLTQMGWVVVAAVATLALVAAAGIVTVLRGSIRSSKDLRIKLRKLRDGQGGKDGEGESRGGRRKEVDQDEKDGWGGSAISISNGDNAGIKIHHHVGEQNNGGAAAIAAATSTAAVASSVVFKTRRGAVGYDKA